MPTGAAAAAAARRVWRGAHARTDRRRGYLQQLDDGWPGRLGGGARHRDPPAGSAGRLRVSRRADRRLRPPVDGADGGDPRRDGAGRRSASAPTTWSSRSGNWWRSRSARCRPASTIRTPRSACWTGWVRRCATLAPLHLPTGVIAARRAAGPGRAERRLRRPDRRDVPHDPAERRRQRRRADPHARGADGRGRLRAGAGPPARRCSAMPTWCWAMPSATSRRPPISRTCAGRHRAAS